MSNLAIEVSPVIAQNYKQLDDIVRECQKHENMLFWEKAQHLAKIQRTCVQCAHMIEGGSGRTKVCPQCGGPVGLFHLETESFESYLGAPDRAISRTVAYRQMKIVDTFAPLLETIGQNVALPVESTEKISAGQSDEQIERLKTARNLLVLGIGWSKLELIIPQTVNCKTPQELMELLEFARTSSKSDIISSRTPEYKFKEEVEALSGTVNKIKAHLKVGKTWDAKRGLQSLQSKCDQFVVKIDAATVN